jgi:hypothetical protein
MDSNENYKSFNQEDWKNFINIDENNSPTGLFQQIGRVISIVLFSSDRIIELENKVSQLEDKIKKLEHCDVEQKILRLYGFNSREEYINYFEKLRYKNDK